jgi:hypothetical protein
MLACGWVCESARVERNTYKHPNKKQQTPWREFASELYRPSHRRLLTKLVPTFVDIRCHVVTVTDPYGRNLGFLNKNRCFFFQVAPQLWSRGWVDPVPDPLLLRKYGSAGNRTRTSGSVELWPLDHRSGHLRTATHRKSFYLVHLR